MWRIRGIQIVATTALCVAALSACGDDTKDPKADPTSTSSSPTTSTATPTLPSESEIASEAASTILRTYFATIDSVRQDPKLPANNLDAVASDSELLAQKNLLQSQRKSDLRQIGDTKVVDLNVQSVSLDDPVKAVVDVCWDVSDVDVVDDTGKSVITPDRKDVGWTRFTVTNPKWKSTPSDGWLVAGGTDLDKEPCAGS